MVALICRWRYNKKLDGPHQGNRPFHRAASFGGNSARSAYHSTKSLKVNAARIKGRAPYVLPRSGCKWSGTITVTAAKASYHARDAESAGVLQETPTGSGISDRGAIDAAG